jgi:hypothetical protein
MCVIISGETQPDSTKLINIPVKLSGDNNSYNFFMYINNFDLNNNNNITRNGSTIRDINFSLLSMSNNSDSKYASFDSTSTSISTYNNNNSIMVVPFPVDPSITIDMIGMVDITTNKMKELKSNVKALKPMPKIWSNSYNASFGATLSRNVLEVHKIGNYNISVATSISDLLNRIDWTKFNKPSDFNQRVSTFENKNLYPVIYKYFYVVASAVENIKDDGFGIVYPRTPDNLTYVPTAHEDTQDTHDFDAEIYLFDFDKTNSVQPLDRINSALEPLSNQRIKMLNNTYKSMSYDKKITSFKFGSDKGNKINHNLFL